MTIVDAIRSTIYFQRESELILEILINCNYCIFNEKMFNIQYSENVRSTYDIAIHCT
jgi:hypothetical protein